MQQARKITETAESNIDERVCATDAALYPYCELVSVKIPMLVPVGCCIPPMGGNRTERMHRKKSGPSHIVRAQIS